MSFKEDLLKSRGHILIIVAIVGSLSAITKLEKYNAKISVDNKIKEYNSLVFSSDEFKKLDLNTKADLNDFEKKYARVAWKYFENNYQPNTGLVNSADSYDASTFWDTASYLMALISAYRLEIINKPTFDERLTKVLDSLGKIQLFDDKVPNKSYNTKTLKMVDYRNKESEKGIGSSSLDIARIMVPFHIIAINYPEYYPKITKILNRFDFSKIIKDGKMHALSFDDKNRIQALQEGRLGYEQYAAKALELFGHDLYVAKKYETNLKRVNINGLDIPVDSRDSKSFGGKNYVLSEPYILDGLEFNWDQTSKDFSYLVYKVQEKRFTNEGILTAMTEDNLDVKPYFAYNSIYNEGKMWSCLDPLNRDASEFKTLSTKASFALNYLYNTEYTSKLMNKIKDNFDENRGWYSGIYEKTGNINKAITTNTNAVILESLAYKKFGKLIRVDIKKESKNNNEK